MFDTPEKAADTLIEAADNFDVAALTLIFGPNGNDIVMSGEVAQDRKHALDFAAEARKKKSVSIDPKTGARAFLLVGEEDWPFPVPLTRVCRQVVLRQQRRQAGTPLPPYRSQRARRHRHLPRIRRSAERICHTSARDRPSQPVCAEDREHSGQAGRPGVAEPRRDVGRAYRGEHRTRHRTGLHQHLRPVSRLFLQDPEGAGPSAPLGEIDYVIKGVMIGGFALVAAPAEYNVTGVRTFTVSNDGVVYEKDLGPATLDDFKKMQRFDPDKTWTAVPDQRN